MFRPIIFLNRRNGHNLGDELSSPLQYFRGMFRGNLHLELHIGGGVVGRRLKKLALINLRDAAHLIVVGGGGLIGNSFFKRDIAFWTNEGRVPAVFWGGGHNSHDVLNVGAMPSVLDYAQLMDFRTIGLRDWGYGYRWVPCASCMNPALHEKTVAGPNTIFALHRDTRQQQPYIEQLLRHAPNAHEIIFNDGNADSFIGKLRAANAIVTNSYHAAYWGTLLGKPVVAVGGGTKIRLLKHQVALAGADDWPKKLSEAVTYNNALEECCDRNVDFSRELAQHYAFRTAPRRGNLSRDMRDPVAERVNEFPVAPEISAPIVARNKVPKIVHFIFGLSKDFGGMPFNVMHHNAVLSVAERAKPEEIFFHHCYEPDNEWYRRIRHLITPKKISPDVAFHGLKADHFAHKSDIVRLDILRESGGIYLDLDTITVKSFDPLLTQECTIGIEGRNRLFGLCNAVLLAEKGASFLDKWSAYYSRFDAKDWSAFSVKLPYLLWRSGEANIHVEPYDRFHWPLWDKDSLKLLFEKDRPFPNAICHHLWESKSYRKYFPEESVEGTLRRLKMARSTYARLAREFL